jgi:hypothetical protein
MNKKQQQADLKAAQAKVQQKFTVFFDKHRSLIKEYEDLYSTLLALLGQAEDHTLRIKKAHRSMLAHQYRIFQKEDPETGDLVLKRLSIYDDLKNQ